MVAEGGVKSDPTVSDLVKILEYLSHIRKPFSENCPLTHREGPYPGIPLFWQPSTPSISGDGPFPPLGTAHSPRSLHGYCGGHCANTQALSTGTWPEMELSELFLTLALELRTWCLTLSGRLKIGQASLWPVTGLVLLHGPRSTGTQSAIWRRMSQMQIWLPRMCLGDAAWIPEGCQCSACISCSWALWDTLWLPHVHFKQLVLKSGNQEGLLMLKWNYVNVELICIASEFPGGIQNAPSCGDVIRKCQHLVSRPLSKEGSHGSSEISQREGVERRSEETCRTTTFRRLEGLRR